MRRSAMSWSRSWSISAPARARAREPRPPSRATSSRFSRPVRNSSSPAYWPVTPIRRRTRSASATDVEAVDQHTTSVGTDERGEDSDQGRLAGAVVAEHSERRALWGGEVDSGEGVEVAEADVHVLDQHGRDAHDLRSGVVPAQHGPSSLAVLEQQVPCDVAASSPVSSARTV